jgi:hypothetical protein
MRVEKYIGRKRTRDTAINQRDKEIRDREQRETKRKGES